MLAPNEGQCALYVTGNGRADAVVRDPGADSGTLRVYAHNGETTSNPWTSYISAAGEWNFADVLLLIGDVTGDGSPDLVACDPGASAGTLWIYRHDGSTSSNPWTLPRVWAGTGWNLANAMALDDVTGDDNLDVIARDGGGALWVYPHNGAPSGNPHTVSRFSADSGWNAAKTLATGDGMPDILARVHAGDLWVYPNNDTTDVPWTSRFEAGSQWGFENTLLLGDVSGDGRPDVIARDPSATDGTLWVYPNNDSTTSNPWTASRVWAGTGWNTAASLALGDVNGDDVPDLIDLEKDGSL